MKNGLSINQSTIMECRTEDFLSACGSVGFRFVELRVPKLKESFYTAPAGTIERLLAEHQIQVVALNSIDDFALVPDQYLPLFEAELGQVAAMCRSISCERVVAPAGRWFGDPLTSEHIIEQTCARLDLAAKVLGDSGISVGFEPIGFPEFSVWELDTANLIISQCKMQNIFLLADIYNLSNGGMSPDEARPYVPRIEIVHVNDANGDAAARRHVMYSRTFPGDGNLAVHDWIRTLLGGGYEGPFSLELFDKELWKLSPEDAARRAYSKLSGYFASLDLGA